MSDESYSGEELNTDTGSYSLDDEDQFESEDTLVDRGVDDVLDEGYSPPEKPLGVDRWGTTAWEQSQDETIDQRILQEEPDPNTAYGAPENWGSPRGTGESDLEDGDRVGGDDPDSIPAEDDFVGDGGRRAGRLVDPDEGVREDEEKDLVAEDVGISGAGASAEEAAMHIATDDTGQDLGTDDEGLEQGLTEATAYRIENESPTNELDSLASSGE
jgi:Family of unknown function (DUF5709)